MNIDGLVRLSDKNEYKSNKPVLIDLYELKGLNIYPFSITKVDGGALFISKEQNEKFLFIVSRNASSSPLLKKTNGDDAAGAAQPADVIIKKCPLTYQNALAVQEAVPFAKPVVIGLKNSIGMGDRLGLANAGHIRSLNGYGFMPILAQQSIRELTRTQRTPQDVMSAAVWAVIQEGYKEGYGADADHLKNTYDIDLLVEAGFTFFTIDPSEHVNNEADNLSDEEAEKIIPSLNWVFLGAPYAEILEKYAGKVNVISPDFSITVSPLDVKRALVKYGNAIAHMKSMHTHFTATHPGYNFELEISVDETESVTTPFEHFFIASELKRLNVDFVSLAPRFIGDFEKGIDYKGDINLFREEYLKHLAIVDYFGTYKLSLHSGSDKFTVYRLIGSLRRSFIHVKTAGTSYLEALRCMSISTPELFREILDYSSGLYENEKKTYHVSADITKVKKGNEYTDAELPELFESNDVRQVLHVTFGRVLTDRSADGSFIFKTRLLECLKSNEELHYTLLEKHFRKHMDPFKN